MSDEKSNPDSSFNITRKDDAWETEFKQEGKHIDADIQPKRRQRD